MSEVAGSKKAQKTLKEHERDKEAQRINDLRWVMQDPRGRRFMFYLLDQHCRLFGASYTGNSETFLNEGKRSVGIKITQELQEKFQDEYVAMISEAFGLKKRDGLVEAAAKEIAKGDES